MRQVFPPSIEIWRDVRHQLANVRRFDGAGGQQFCDYVAASIQYSWSLPTIVLFSTFWDAVLVEFVRAGRLRMVRYVEEQVLTWDEKTMLDSGLVEWTLLHSMPRIRDINFVSCCLKAGFPGTVMTRGGLGLHGQVS